MGAVQADMHALGYACGMPGKKHQPAHSAGPADCCLHCMRVARCPLAHSNLLLSALRSTRSQKLESARGV